MESLLTAKEVAKILKMTVRSPFTGFSAKDVFQRPSESHLPPHVGTPPKLRSLLRNAPRFEANSAD